MADVKWIKITTDIFDDEKMLLIESLPDSYAIIVVWFKLLCLAGKMNNSGVFLMNDKIAYTDKMLSTIFRMKESTVQLALHTFQEFGMIELIDGVITIPNWGKHQNLDQLEEKKQYMKEYMRNYREKQKSISCKTNCKTNSKANVSSLEEDKEKDKEKDIYINDIFDSYNSICKSLPRANKLTDQRKTHIKARLKKYTKAEIIKCFETAEASDFLTGKTKNKFVASFDWLINENNLNKVLEGNYANRKSNNSNFEQRDDDFDAIAEAIMMNQEKL